MALVYEEKMDRDSFVENDLIMGDWGVRVENLEVTDAGRISFDRNCYEDTKHLRVF